MRIFVYGTLKRGLSNHRWISDQQFVTEARTAPRYRLVDCGGYPGMLPAEEGGLSILGEVWEVDEAGRKKLDILEDVEAGLYALELVELEPQAQAQGAGPVMTYIYKRPAGGLRDVGEEWREDSRCP